MVCALTFSLKNFSRVSPAELFASLCFLLELVRPNPLIHTVRRDVFCFLFQILIFFNIVLEGQDFWVAVIILLD